MLSPCRRGLELLYFKKKVDKVVALTTQQILVDRYNTDAEFHARVHVGVQAAKQFRAEWRGGSDEEYYTMQVIVALGAAENFDAQNKI